MDDLIRRSDVQNRCHFIQDEHGEWILAADIIKLPAVDAVEYELADDGTLAITVPKGMKVGRVLVSEAGTHWGGLYYPDVEDAVEVCRCGDCRYKDDGIDEDGIPFLKCLHGRSYGGTRINDYCSWGQRREDGDT